MSVAEYRNSRRDIKRMLSEVKDGDEVWVIRRNKITYPGAPHQYAWGYDVKELRSFGGYKLYVDHTLTLEALLTECGTIYTSKPAGVWDISEPLPNVADPNEGHKGARQLNDRELDRLGREEKRIREERRNQRRGFRRI
jgi:hypothetical protein